MKNVMFGLFGCLISLQCFAGTVQELDGKLYVSPGSVFVSADAIYVNIDDNFVPVEGVFSDSNGIYIQNFESRHMYCIKCKKYHDPSVTKCAR